MWPCFGWPASAAGHTIAAPPGARLLPIGHGPLNVRFGQRRKVIGAIGVSGDTPQVDEAIAIAGASAFR